MIAASTDTERIYLFERPPWNRRWVWWLVAALLAGFDFLTGPYLLFPVFFVLPVMIMAWNCDMPSAVSLAIALSLARFGFHLVWDSHWTIFVAVLNGLSRVVVLGLLAIMTAKLGSQTRTLRERVHTLEGILPVCGFCKDIRDEDGQWQRMESYVSQRSQAQFSHGVCPKCVAEHYREFAASTGVS